MPATKSPSRPDHDKNQVRNPAHAIASATQVQRLAAKPTQVVSTVQEAPSAKVAPGRKQTGDASAAAKGATVESKEPGGSVGRDQNRSRPAQPAQTTRAKAWTVEAAGRIASATARNGGGTVKKGSFAADAMSKAMKNEHRRKDNG